MENLVSFVDDLADFNPRKKKVKVPPFNPNQCCVMVEVTGIDLDGEGEGVYYLQNETRFDHPYYINFDTGLELFFEKHEYNIGQPLSSVNNRISMRSDCVMEDIYKVLERPPCAEDLKHWAYRQSDDDEWTFDRQIQEHFKKSEYELLRVHGSGMFRFRVPGPVTKLFGIIQQKRNEKFSEIHQ